MLQRLCLRRAAAGAHCRIPRTNTLRRSTNAAADADDAWDIPTRPVKRKQSLYKNAVNLKLQTNDCDVAVDTNADVLSESDHHRTRLSNRLLAFQNDPFVTKLEMPAALTNAQRSIVHQLAQELGLLHVSIGEGEARYVVVTKPNPDKVSRAAAAAAADATAPPVKTPVLLDIGRSGMQAMQLHLRTYPPTIAETLANEGAVDPATTVDNSLGKVSQQQQQHSQYTHASRRSMDLQARQQYHERAQMTKINHVQYATRQSQRAKLPAFAHQQRLVDAVAKSPVTIVQGETGCGKSTQVPQYLLDANPCASLVVTQRTYRM
jgi:hypothetical protein